MKLQKSVRLYTDKHFENIGNIFTTLYEDSLLTDCILYCKDGSLKAHKVILAASSRYFRQVFVEHNDDNAIFMYGISYSQLKKLIELIYRGNIDIPYDSFDSVYGLCEELKITGVNIESTETRTNGTGRDTRYKGQKRVTVDYEAQTDNVLPVPSAPSKSVSERRNSTGSEKSVSRKGSETDLEFENNSKHEMKPITKIENSKDESNLTDQDGVDDQEQSSAWARKERKFKCDLCPSSFKRASHLNRHQLVHTGERPFPCDQCDKAFSRHDKLKHHIHKTHELGALNEALGPDSLYTIDRVDILTPETCMVEPQKFLSPDPVISSVCSVPKMEFSEQPQTKKRGRPRKYPPIPKSPIKRPRGRPRIKPEVALPLNKRPRGRPRVKLIGGSLSRVAYQYHSSDFDSVGYLPKSHPTPSELESSQEMMSDLANVDMIGHDQGIMEPLVEIKTDNTDAEECSKNDKIQPQTSTNSFFENIGLFENTTTIAKIGECTISVATSCPNTSVINTGNINN